MSLSSAKFRSKGAALNPSSDSTQVEFITIAIISRCQRLVCLHSITIIMTIVAYADRCVVRMIFSARYFRSLRWWWRSFPTPNIIMKPLQVLSRFQFWLSHFKYKFVCHQPSTNRIVQLEASSWKFRNLQFSERYAQPFFFPTLDQGLNARSGIPTKIRQITVHYTSHLRFDAEGKPDENGTDVDAVGSGPTNEKPERKFVSSICVYVVSKALRSRLPEVI